MCEYVSIYICIHIYVTTHTPINESVNFAFTHAHTPT